VTLYTGFHSPKATSKDPFMENNLNTKQTLELKKVKMLIDKYPICRNFCHQLKINQKNAFDHEPEHSAYCDCMKPEVDPKSIVPQSRVAPDGTFIEY
jgi:hypothetical protein